MTTALTLPVPDRQFVALTPAELPTAQRQVATWCRAKICALGLDLKEQRENLREAKRMLWRHHGWSRAVQKTIKRMIYYAKIQQAVRAGYLIIPNFNVDVIAVRVEGTPALETGYSRLPAKPDLLPPGRGRFVDDKLQMRDDSYVEKQADGKGTKRIEQFTAVGYVDEVDFPVALVKPAILAATSHAMALKVFDRIGIVKASRRSDPIVVGQIIDPREKYWPQNPRCVSFFVAWWLDTKEL